METQLRVGIITQADPFYLADTLDYLLGILPKDGIAIVVAVVFPGSPFGRRMGFTDKALATLRTFGPRFFVHYGLRYAYCRMRPAKSVASVLGRRRIPTIADIRNVNAEDSIRRIMSYRPDILVSIGGNQIFKRDLIHAAPQGMLNLHTSLLPQYRGLMPTFWVLKNDEKETGVSVFVVDEGIDSGEILVQRRVPIHGQTQARLIRETKRVGMDALVEALLAIKTDTTMRLPNPDASSTYFKFPTREDVKEFYRRGKRFF
ncbi:MAG: formyltransferase family protein [Phycisphaerales bacterium]|jgi:methionyl-tRNA formyltransferase